MGSCMSGNYGRRCFVSFAEDRPTIDLLVWQRRGWLHPGMRACGRFELSQPDGRIVKAYCECEIEDRIGSLRARFDRLPDLAIDMACTSQNLGGVRWWLVCPLCDANRRKLYYGRDGAWGCRACLQLRYRSQHSTAAARAKARCEWYFERANTFRWVAEPKRPRRMHRARFERLLARGRLYQQRWRELGILPAEREFATFLEKVRKRNARALRRLIPR